MEFICVNARNVMQAASVHAVSWRASHKHICSQEFIDLHTPQRQAAYLLGELEAGKQVVMLVDHEPVGLVSVQGSLIENLYVLPQHWRKGYGSALLAYAERLCVDVPTLWILSGNEAAHRLYEKHGYAFTGCRKQLSEVLYEMEMKKQSR